MRGKKKRRMMKHMSPDSANAFSAVPLGSESLLWAQPGSSAPCVIAFSDDLQVPAIMEMTTGTVSVDPTFFESREQESTA